MIEVEIKVRIEEPDLIRIKFLKLDGVYKLSLNHEDTYFNMPKGLRDFKESDEALRIRKSTSFNKENMEKSQKLEYYLTYKGRKIDTSTKTRQELDMKIEDGDKLKEILKILGFQEVITVKKERELYEFNHKNYHIEALIDYLPILKKYFIEVEYLVDNEEKIEEARNILFDFLTLLNIRKEESIRKSYLELIMDEIKEKWRNRSNH